MFCIGAAKCELKCHDTSTCTFDCRQMTAGGDCKRKVDCKTDSGCVLYCPAQGPCGFNKCEDSNKNQFTPVDCNGNGSVWACNHACP